MDKTKTVNASTNSTNVHALNEPSNEAGNVHVPNEPSNESGNLNTENSHVTHFRPITKGNWKRTNEEDSDSDSSHAPTDKLTSDHSSDHIVSDDNVSVTDDISLEISILPVVENDFIYE